ncbi:MAG: hypothetical protein V4577_04465 [Bacteroidota bacterium]
MAKTATTPPTPSPKGQDPKEQFKPIFIFCMAVFLIGLTAALIRSSSLAAAMTAVEWTLACMISGAFMGFLFGVPKVVQSSGSAAPAGTGAAAPGAAGNGKNYQQLVNTNLSEISDWLTKIIVGLGLVKLTKIPPYLAGMAGTLAAGLDGAAKTGAGSSLAFAYGLIISFFVVGFLFGYLVTRLYLAGEFNDADKRSLSDLADLINTTQAKVDNIQAGQTMLTQSVVQNAAQTAPADKQAKLDNLKAQATAYMQISSPDYGERVRLKEDSAGEMSAYALSNQISKDDILQLLAGTVPPNEGLVIALATLVITRPETGDLTRLLSAGANITRMHVRYRVLNAISQLISQHLINVSDKDSITALIDAYRKGADSSLLQKADSVAAMVKSYS